MSARHEAPHVVELTGMPVEVSIEVQEKLARLHGSVEHYLRILGFDVSFREAFDDRRNSVAHVFESKRQLLPRESFRAEFRRPISDVGHAPELSPVSYTHLTLPTNREVEIS